MIARTMTCVEFFARVLRLTLTNGQTAFVAVAVDGRLPRELEGAVRDAALEMFGDIDELTPLALRTVVAAMGRDSGKTQLGAGIALFKLMTVDLSRVGPGDVATAGVVAPREKTARIALRRAVALVRRSPELRKRLVGAPRKDGFTLKRGDRHVAFEVFAASRGGASLRGPSWIAVIFDEAAQFRDESAAVNDEELYSAVMPRVLPGGVVLFLSTPWSEEGLFWKLANDNHGTPHAAVVAIAPTLLMRDQDPELAAMIALERERDPDNAAREFDAQFMGTGGALFFDAKSITDAIDDALVVPTGRRPGELVRFGGDLGLVRDSSALVGCGALGATKPLVRVVSIVERQPKKGEPLKLSEVIATFAGELRTFKETSFMADGHAREPAREWTARERVEIVNRPEGRDVKYSMFVALREAFRDRRMALPRHSRLLAMLRAVTLKPQPGGGWKITQPRRIGQAHGDLVDALALAHWQVRLGAGDEDDDLIVANFSTRGGAPTGVFVSRGGMRRPLDGDERGSSMTRFYARLERVRSSSRLMAVLERIGVGVDELGGVGGVDGLRARGATEVEATAVFAVVRNDKTNVADVEATLTEERKTA